MIIKVQTAKFVAHPGSVESVSAADIDLSQNPKYQDVGRLIVLAKSYDPNVSVNTVISGFAKKFFDNKDKSLDTLLGLIKDAPSPLIAAYLFEGKINIAGTKGDFEVFLNRNHKLALILDKSKESTEGILEDNDVFLLATTEFTDNVDIKSLPLSKDFKEIDELITKSKDSSKQAVSLIVKVNLDDISSSTKQLPSEPIVIHEPLIKKQKFRLPLKRVLVKLLDMVITRLPDKSIRLKGDTETLEKDKNKRTAVSVGIILLILLVISIIFGLKQQRNKELKATYETRFQEASHQFSEATNLKDLDPGRARELLLSSQNLTQSILDEGIKDQSVDKLMTDIKNNLGPVAGIYQDEPDIFIDLSLLTENFSGNDLSLSGGNLLILDSQSKKLIQVAVDTKKSQIVAGPQTLPEALAVANYIDRDFVLSQKGFWEVGKEAELVLEKNWEGDVLVHVFGGNLYLLEKQSSEIYRFAQTASGRFGSRQNWFGPGLNLDLSDAMDLSVDGSIWVLFPQGKIQKYTRGTVDSFKLGNIDKGVTQATDIYTDEDNKYLYILDKGNNRVVVVTKDGDYVAEYSNSQIKDTQKIVVSEKDNKLLLLTGPKLYSVELKHLSN